MSRNRTTILVCSLGALAAVVTAATLAMVGRAPPSESSAPAARTSCSAALIRDWSDGRIDRSYSVACYRAALHSLPADLQVYSSAPEDIRQAMSARIVQSSKRRTLASHG